jgi:hypothetical protein
LSGLSWLLSSPAAPPARPTPPREPPRVVTFTANVYSVKKVTRGNAFGRTFDHYDISFTGTSNGQDNLKVYKSVPEDDMRRIIGQKVVVTCLQAPTLRNCHYLTRLVFEGREIATQEATSR